MVPANFHLRFFNLISLIFLGVILSFSPVYAEKTPTNVILVMLDGVRWQEVFYGASADVDENISEEFKTPLFLGLFQNSRSRILAMGDSKRNLKAPGLFKDAPTRSMKVSNQEIVSLPAYQSVMAGQNTGCSSNSCGRTPVETVQEKLVNVLKLPKTSVATFSSWPKIALAVEHIKGKALVNSGNEPLSEGVMNSTTAALNELQDDDSPSWSGRKDAYTFAQALNFLRYNKPRFLFISLNDADEYGHKGKYLSYLMTLKWYAEEIQHLFNVLDAMGEYGRSTTVLITTDHGRGDGKNWKHHGAEYPEAQYIWMLVRNAEQVSARKKLTRAQSPRPVSMVPSPGSLDLSHLDIRPTLEKLMGLSPTQCQGCGNVIPDFIQPVGE